MFVLTTIADTVRIPPSLLAQPTLTSVHGEMDKKYPNRVIMDVGLVICRYGNALEVGDGVCVAGDGGAHHEAIVRLVVFRPFVEEVCLGTISKSTQDGIRVSLGFFDDVFIPAYWMLRPSHYEKESGLWIWTPKYDDVEEPNDETAEENRFEMEIGAQIRFKVKSINFTQVTNTAKGVQATTTTTAQSPSLFPSMDRKSLTSGEDSNPTESLESFPDRPVRKRSSSLDLSDSKIPASMHIVGSICEDGLGLTSWWSTPQEDDNEDAEMDENSTQ